MPLNSYSNRSNPEHFDPLSTEKSLIHIRRLVGVRLFILAKENDLSSSPPPHYHLIAPCLRDVYSLSLWLPGLGKMKLQKCVPGVYNLILYCNRITQLRIFLFTLYYCTASPNTYVEYPTLGGKQMQRKTVAVTELSSLLLSIGQYSSRKSHDTSYQGPL